MGVYWVAAETAIKPFPNCRLTHSAIEAAIELHKRFGKIDDGVFEVRLDPTSYRLVGEDVPTKRTPRNIVDGQFSVYFQVAVGLLTGRSNWDSYALLGNPEVEHLTSKISVVSDDTKNVGQTVLSGRIGEVVENIEIEKPIGEPERPLGWDGVLEKYNGLAGPVLGVDRARSLADAIREMETLDDVAPLISMARKLS